MTQHAGRGAKPDVLRALLEAAFRHAGEEVPGDEITAELVRAGVLTANVRSGRAQAWRDYQQVLSEFGLIISTAVERAITITPIGMLFLDGEINHEELITTQALRYQYPNGQKMPLPQVVRDVLGGQTLPATRTQLDFQKGVLIKPGVLLWRVLHELRQQGMEPSITAHECALFLMPLKTHAEWVRGLETISAHRSGESVARPDARRTRHAQEWFKLLAHARPFELGEDDRLSLAHEDSEAEERIRTAESTDSFWRPPEDFDRRAIALSWFEYYGNPDTDEQWLESAVQERPAAGLSGATGSGTPRPRINLRSFRPGSGPTAGSPRQIDLARIQAGYIRQVDSHRLHEYIVVKAAEHLAQAGFTLSEDRSSVDLFGSRQGRQVIVEVKTVTARSLRNKIRAGAAQVAEYRYRYQREHGTRPECALILSSAAVFPTWLLEWLEQEMQVELLSLGKDDGFVAHTQGALSSLF